MVEARTGRTVREIFETDGEAAFRPLETEALLDALASPEPAVIAAAGGVVLSPVNRAALRRAGRPGGLAAGRPGARGRTGDAAVTTARCSTATPSARSPA